MSPTMSRRPALAAGAALLAAPWLAPGRARADAGAPRRLVVVMLRGAVDGLSVVVPHGDPEYARQRAEIAIPPPGAADGALPLDGPFALHPALAPLRPLWDAGRLAFVHAAGSHDPTRSHFDAQDHLETATPGRRSTPDGWMNRLLGVLAEAAGADARSGADAPAATLPVRGANLGPTMPRILAGPAPVTALPAGAGERRSPPSAVAVASAVDALHRADPVTAAAWAAMSDTQRLLTDADQPGMDPGIARGAVPFAALATDAQRLGRLLRREPSMRAAFFSVGGWDTHVNQGGARGQLATRLAALAGGLAALVDGLDDALAETLILVVSEFGRTVRQNGTQGTDHGHGNVIWAIGGRVRGGQVLGAWPGLAPSALHEGRDLAVTTDFRQVIAVALAQHLRLGDRAIARVLPDGAGAGPPPALLAG
jgi:uncharacterized protein (DUF1501 family)